MSTVTTGFCSLCWTHVPLVPLMVELQILYWYRFGFYAKKKKKKGTTYCISSLLQLLSHKYLGM